MRGVDSEGHSANFVETEQITETQGARASYVQVWINILYIVETNVSRIARHVNDDSCESFKTE